MTTYYEILGIGRDAGPDEIKKAYHKLALLFHPDKNKTPEAAEKMRQINTAYQVLSEPKAKARYDRSLDNTFDLREFYPGNNSVRQPSWQPGDGYEAPRHTVYYQYTTYFSLENIIASIFISGGLGVIAFATIIFTSDLPGLKGSLIFDALIVLTMLVVTPLIALVTLRKTIRSDGEAGLVGSISLSLALMFAMFSFTSIYSITGNVSPILQCACCGLIPVLGIIGWPVGGRIGKLARM